MHRLNKSVSSLSLRLRSLIVIAALLLLSPDTRAEREARSIWYSRCQQCHGDAAAFARERLWNVDGQLHGKRHDEEMQQFLSRHHLPAMQVQIVREMLLSLAKSTARFYSECGSCHGTAAEFIEKSLWVRRDSITSLATGKDIAEFLTTHRNLSPDDARFFFELLLHVGNVR